MVTNRLQQSAASMSSCNFTSQSHSEIARLSRKEHEVGSRLPQSQQGSTREKLYPQWLSDDLAAYLEQK